MTRLATLACIMTLGAGMPAVAEGQWTWNGANGGTASGTRSCAGTGSGGYVCSGQSTYVGPAGRTTAKTSYSTGNGTAGQRTGTTTLPDGQARTRTYSWRRGN